MMIYPDAYPLLFEFPGCDLGRFYHVARTHQADIAAFIVDRDSLAQFELVAIEEFIVLYFAADDPEVKRPRRFNGAAQRLGHFQVAAWLDNRQVRDAQEHAQLF